MQTLQESNTNTLSKQHKHSLLLSTQPYKNKASHLHIRGKELLAIVHQVPHDVLLSCCLATWGRQNSFNLVHREFRSVQDGIYALKKKTICTPPHLSVPPNVAFETVPMSVWLTMVLPRPFREHSMTNTQQSSILQALCLAGYWAIQVRLFSLDFCPASLKSLGCFYFRCVASSQWKVLTVNLRILHCQL